MEIAWEPWGLCFCVCETWQILILAAALGRWTEPTTKNVRSGEGGTAAEHPTRCLHAPLRTQVMTDHGAN
jgi:hypothetical protein